MNLRLAAAVLSLPILGLWACSSNSTPTKTTALTVTPASAVLTAGTQITFAATGTSDAITWSLNPNVGTLSATTGTSVVYTAPNGIESPQTITLQAAAGDSSNATVSIALVQGSTDAGPGTTTGTLTITVTGIDAGSTFPSVTVTGADFDGLFPSSLTTLFLAPGVYQVSAPAFSGTDSVVGEQFLPTIVGSPATVSLGQNTNVSVTYAARAQSGTLWVPSCQNSNPAINGAVRGFNSGQLHTDGGAFLADASVQTLWTDGGCTEAVIFDPQGKLWAIDQQGASAGKGPSKIWGWTLLADGGTSAPTVVIPQTSDGGLLDPVSGAFTVKGDLWAVDYANSQVQLYTAGQLAAGGAQVPSAVIHNTAFAGPHNSINLPYGIAFDSSGNLWVGNYGENTVSKFSSVSDGGFDPNPSALIYDTSGTLGQINGISFDSSGDLWIANYANGKVVRVNVTGLSGVTALSPTAVLIPNATTGLTQVDDVTFDLSGNLWVMDQNSATLRVFANPRSFVGTVSVAPSWVYTTFVQDVGRVQFNPPAAGLGLFP